MKLTYSPKIGHVLFLASLGFFLFSSVTFGAAVTNGVISGNAVADLVASTTDADYNVSFDAATAATSTSITVTFPTGFTITNGTIATSSICNSGCALAGKISASSTNVTVTSLTGSTANRTIIIAFADSNLNSSTTIFRITVGIQNATTTGLTGTSSIATNAVGATAQNNVAGVTLTYDAIVATKLTFTTQPSGAISGIALTTQPVVTAQDANGVTDTDFVSTVTLTETGAGSITAGSTKAAVSGVATFTGVIYNPSADGESFTFLADGGSLTTGTSNSLAASFYHGLGGKTYGVVKEPTVTTPPPVTPPPAPIVPAPVPTVPPVPAPTPAATAAEQRQLVNSLLAQLRALVQQAMALGISIPPEMQVYLTPSKLSDATANLMMGSTGQEVKMLQQFLNSHGFALTQSGAGSMGHETTRFGALTRTALMKYQTSVSIPASGVFDSATRDYLKLVGF